MTRDEALEHAVAMVKRAKGYTSDVEFSPMDATRSDRDYLHRVLEAVIDAGATTINIADTVGFITPMEFGQMIDDIRESVPNAGKIVLSVHCHNDLGMAVVQLAGRRAERRPPGGVHDQRHRRAGRQRRARRDSHGGQDAARDLSGRDGHRYVKDLQDEPPRLEPDGHGGPAEQGGRWLERLRPRVRHPPGWRAEGAHDVRDHGRAQRRAREQHAGARASTPGATRCGRASRRWATSCPTKK